MRGVPMGQYMAQGKPAPSHVVRMGSLAVSSYRDADRAGQDGDGQANAAVMSSSGMETRQQTVVQEGVLVLAVPFRSLGGL
jgi:hypothetical protein